MEVVVFDLELEGLGLGRWCAGRGYWGRGSDAG